MPKRLPWNRVKVTNPDTANAYALADEHTPKYQRAWLYSIRNVNEAAAVVTGDALTAYYYAPAAITAVDASPAVNRALATMKRKLIIEHLDLWSRTYNKTKSGRELSDIILPDKNNFEEELFSTMMGKPELYNAAMVYAENASSTMVRQVLPESRLAIQSAIQDGVSTGQHPRVIARKIKDIGIGLPDKGPFTNGRVARYRAAQEAAGVVGGVLDARVAKFHDKMLRKRAESIARTEMIRTQASARQATWVDEKNKGLISDGSYRVWISGAGERTCDRCVLMDGAKAPIGGTYENGEEGPPLHPQ